MNMTRNIFGDGHDDEHFRLDDSFLRSYAGRSPAFGYNGLGEFVFYRTYSRRLGDRQKETFLDTLQRVVEGCYEIQRRHCRRLHIPWDYGKAKDSAHEMFERMWDFKFLPPGRGLWMMGTQFMWERGSAALQSCAFVSTNDLQESDPAEPFCFLMDMSMLGVGVGFDTKGANRVRVNRPSDIINKYTIADSREGWVDSVRNLIRSYTINADDGSYEFDYSHIRPAGTPINGFGGYASGPDILRTLHERIRHHLDSVVGKTLSSTDIVDIMNYIGACIVAGHVRRSSEIALGGHDDPDYCSMKNFTYGLNDEMLAHFMHVAQMNNGEPLTMQHFEHNEQFRHAVKTYNALSSHRWASNNSVLAEIGMDYREHAARTAINGEPGYQWLDNIRDYGRMVDGRRPGIDGRACGCNPCGEQSLESYEMCNLVETFPSNHENAADYIRTLKFAYLYGKTVTLLPCHNSRTNQVMLRNRRIGVSQSGIVQAFAKFGRRQVLQDFCDAGYNEVRRWDLIYSEWLCVQRSLKVTSVKPSGTVSLLAGVTPGIHYPEATTYWRRVRLSASDKLIPKMIAAGYDVEQSVTDPGTMIVKFAVTDERIHATDKVSIWQQVANAVDYQRYWSDNQVSITVKVRPDELDQIASVLETFEDRLKGISFLPISGHGYEQAPYEPCTVAEVEAYNARLKPINFAESMLDETETGSKYCDSDTCLVKRN